jgi:hypothetical protein
MQSSKIIDRFTTKGGLFRKFWLQTLAPEKKETVLGIIGGRAWLPTMFRGFRRSKGSK